MLSRAQLQRSAADGGYQVETYEKATTEGDRKGAVMLGDEMIDEASRKVAVKLVSRGERAGMRFRPALDRKVVRAQNEDPRAAQDRHYTNFGRFR